VRLRVAIALGLAGTVAIGGAAIYASSGSPAQPRGACRDWLAANDYRRQIAAVRPLVPKMKRAFAAPGLSIAVAADGKLVWSQSCGFADLGRRRVVTRTTQFRIGSVSKPITAATAARLHQEARLDIGADVRKYVPAFPASRPAVTLRYLGGHLGGIRHYRGAEAVNATHYRSLAHSLQVFINDPLVAAPGERFSYSSYGFNLLGAAVENAASAPFAKTVEEVLLRPLRMRSTRLGGSPTPPTRFYEVTVSRRAVLAPRIDLSDRYPSGGFVSTAEDLVRLGVGVIDPSFLNAEVQSLLFSSQRTRSGEATGYGFGFEVRESPLGVMAGHTGNVVGGTAFLLIHPRTRVVVALTTNIGFVTAATAPSLAGVPDPPQLAMPFIRRVGARS
jgi:serine beta-lactamase-like protein LACTB